MRRRECQTQADGAATECSHPEPCLLWDNKLKEFCRERGLKMALGWIDDPRAKDFHSTK